MIYRCRGPKRLDEWFQMGKNRDIPLFIALDLSLITQTLSSTEGSSAWAVALCHWPYQLKISLPGRGTIAACCCPDRDWSIL
jgi:hypothetical protein